MVNIFGQENYKEIENNLRQDPEFVKNYGDAQIENKEIVALIGVRRCPPDSSFMRETFPFHTQSVGAPGKENQDLFYATTYTN